MGENSNDDPKLGGKGSRGAPRRSVEKASMLKTHCVRFAEDQLENKTGHFKNNNSYNNIYGGGELRQGFSV